MRIDMNPSNSETLISRAARPEPRSDGRTDQIVAAIMLLLTAFVPAMSKLHPTGEIADDSIYNQLVWGLMYVIAAVKISAIANIRAILRYAWPLVGFSILMLLSSLWSVAPDVTRRESIELTGTTLVGVYLVVLFPLEKLLKTLSYVIAAIAAASLLLIVVAPARGRLFYGAGAWSGIYEDKNLLGAAMALGIVSLVAFAVHSRGWSFVRVFLTIAICAIILVGANSATSLVGCGSTLVLMLTILLLRPSKNTVLARTSIVTVAVVSLAFIGITGFQTGSLFDLIGRSSDLTGRTTFWPALWTAIYDRPILGFGYGAFFKSTIATDYLGDFLAGSGGWTPYHAHNSFLQVLLNGGYSALSLCIVSLIVGIWRGLIFAFRSSSRTSVWPIGVIFYLIIGSFSETYLFGINNIEAVLFIAAFLYPIRRHLLKTVTEKEN
jgi:exopolysaccharide production protein ExoQ